MSGDLVYYSNLALSASDMLLLYFSKRYLAGKTTLSLPPGHLVAPFSAVSLSSPRSLTFALITGRLLRPTVLFLLPWYRTLGSLLPYKNYQCIPVGGWGHFSTPRFHPGGGLPPLPSPVFLGPSMNCRSCKPSSSLFPCQDITSRGIAFPRVV